MILIFQKSSQKIPHKNINIIPTAPHLLNIFFKRIAGYLEEIHQRDKEFWWLKSIVSIVYHFLYAIFTAWFCQLAIQFFTTPKRSQKNFIFNNYFQIKTARRSRNNVQKRIASLRILLDSEHFKSQNFKKIDRLTHVLNKSQNSDEKNISNLINRYNVNFAIAFLLDEINVFISFTGLEQLSSNGNKSYYKSAIQFNDPYKASLLLVFLAELDLISYNDDGKPRFNRDTCSPSFATYLPAKDSIESLRSV